MQALQQSNLYSDKQTQGCFVWIHDSVCVCVCVILCSLLGLDVWVCMFVTILGLEGT